MHLELRCPLRLSGRGYVVVRSGGTTHDATARAGR